MKRLLACLLLCPALSWAGITMVEDEPGTGAATTASAAPATPASDEVPTKTVQPAPLPFAVIEKDERIDLAIQKWAEQDGYTFTWNAPQSWLAVAHTDFSHFASVPDAIEEVISILIAEGKPIRLATSTGNKVIEVFSTEIKQ